MCDSNICSTCGFPKDVDRQPVFVNNDLIVFVLHKLNECPECGHQEDGSTIEDDDIYEKYKGK